MKCNRYDNVVRQRTFPATSTFFFSPPYGDTSRSYDAPSIATTIHRRKQTIYLQLIKKQTNKRVNKKVTYLHIYRMENCLDVVGLDL